MTAKSNDYISWSEFFMGVAELAAKRSKDPNTKVGACIVNDKNIILSTGYNGMPIGCNDDDMPWCREGAFDESKYAYVCHAELNAILNCDGRSLKGSTLYVTNFPCNECAKAIIQAGIRKVIFLEDKYPDSDATKVAKMLFVTCGVDVLPFDICELNEVTITSGDGEKFKLYFDGKDYALPEDRLGPIEHFEPKFDPPGADVAFEHFEPKFDPPGADVAFEDCKLTINIKGDVKTDPISEAYKLAKIYQELYR